MQFWLIILLLSIPFFSCTNANLAEFKQIKKGLHTISGTFINDTIPHGIIETFDEFGRIISKENFHYGVLNGEVIYYYKEESKIKIKTNYLGGREFGLRYSFDSSRNLINKATYYFGKQIGPDFLYDSYGRVSEYSFGNFENNMLYYCYFDIAKDRYVYPSDSHLMKVTTQPVSFNDKEKLYIFLYVLNPPKLRLEYNIAVTGVNDSLITLQHVSSESFFYEYYLKLRDEKQKVAIVLNKYDSVTKTKSVVIEYLKTSFPDE